MMPRTTVLAVVGSFLVASMAAAQTPQPPPPPQGNGQRPARDRAATRPAPVGTGRLSGRVVAADTGRPLARVRVLATSNELPGGRATTTDDQGAFQITALPAGRYNVNASRSGFVNMSYGQQRPRQAGTPLQLGDGQTVGDLNFSLPRGGVITGQIVDDMGEPLVGANVTVQRYESTPAGRRLIPAGQGSTDDRGSYRVWGLMPGDYYVSASVRNFNMMTAGGFGLAEPVVITNVAGEPGTAVFSSTVSSTSFNAVAGVAVAAAVTDGPDVTTQRVALAPTYYPGVTQMSSAQPVVVAAGAEATGVSFGVLVVRTALIRGQVTMSDGKAPARGNVMLMPEGSVGAGPGSTLGSGIQANGSFSIGYVPPGQYTLRARGGTNESPQFAQQSISVGDGDTQNVSLILAPGTTLSGTVSFQGSGAVSAPDPGQVRVMAQAADGAEFGVSNARVDREGRFTMTGLAAGSFWLRAQGNLRGWALKSILVDGHDALDAPFEVRGSQPVSGISVVFTDRISEINGTLTDRQQQPLSGYTMLAFPTDADLWRPQTRRIMTARPDQNGRYQLRGLPPGDYYVTPVDAIEPGDAYEPAFLAQRVANAARVSFGEGESKTQSFTLSSP